MTDMDACMCDKQGKKRGGSSLPCYPSLALKIAVKCSHPYLIMRRLCCLDNDWP